MKNLISVAVTTLVVIGISAAPAAAKHRKYHHVSHHQMHRGGSSYGMMPMRGQNAELMGNNGNSGQGSNSLGHIQGGNIGGGK